jgi:hypothetical protein
MNFAIQFIPEAAKNIFSNAKNACILTANLKDCTNKRA